MPELPEVEATRRLVEEHVKGDRLARVVARELGGGPRDGLFDDIVVAEGVTEDAFTSALLGRTVVGVGRKGKQLWFDLDAPSAPRGGKHRGGGGGGGGSGSRHSLLVHLGMTGALCVRGVDSFKFVSHQYTKESQWPPRFTKVLMHFESGVEIAFTDPRRLGRLLIRPDATAGPPVSLLAPDPTHGEGVPLPHARDVLRATSAPIKAVLLDQRRLVSGVGNWICDDVLLHAGIHPETSANALAPAQVERLVDALHEICRSACEVNADYVFFPRHWLFHERWGTGRKGQVKLPDGRVAVYSVVAGRSTVHIPALQKKGGGGGGGGGAAGGATGKARTNASAGKAGAKGSPVVKREPAAATPARRDTASKRRGEATTPKPARTARAAKARVAVAPSKSAAKASKAPSGHAKTTGGKVRAVRSRPQQICK